MRHDLVRTVKWCAILLVAVALVYSISINAYYAVKGAQVIEEYSAPGRMVDIGTHEMHIHCVGNGSPTVILDHGLTGFSAQWIPLMNEARPISRVCAYDRSGLGWSDAAPGVCRARLKLL